MSIERPSQADIQKFLLVQDGKRYTGNWYGAIPHIAAIGAATALFSYTLYKSMSPSGIVPRILYEKTLSPPMRHLRHFFPAVVGIGSLYIWDYYTGVWSSRQ